MIVIAHSRVVPEGRLDYALLSPYQSWACRRSLRCLLTRCSLSPKLVTEVHIHAEKYILVRWTLDFEIDSEIYIAFSIGNKLFFSVVPILFSLTVVPKLRDELNRRK